MFKIIELSHHCWLYKKRFLCFTFLGMVFHESPTPKIGRKKKQVFCGGVRWDEWSTNLFFEAPRIREFEDICLVLVALKLPPLGDQRSPITDKKCCRTANVVWKSRTCCLGFLRMTTVLHKSMSNFKFPSTLLINNFPPTSPTTAALSDLL